MSYQTVPTVATGDSWSAAQHNTYIKNNFSELWPYTAYGDFAYAASSSTLTTIPMGNFYEILTSDGSVPAWTENKNRLGVSIVSSTYQVVNPNTWTTVIFTESFLNNANMWDVSAPTAFTVPETGIYRINGSVSFEFATNGGYMTARLLDPSEIYLDSRESAVNQNTYLSFSYTAKFDSTKTYNFQVHRTDSPPDNMNAYISIIYIGPSL